MNPRLVLDEFKRELRDLYGECLKDVILFGSYERGEAHAGSDIDVMVVLRGDVAPGREIDRMIDVITDLNLKYSVLLSVVPVAEEKSLHKEQSAAAHRAARGSSRVTEIESLS